MVTNKPTEDDRDFWVGEIVFDRNRSEILSDPLCVVGAQTIPLRDLEWKDEDTYDAVKFNTANIKMMSGDFEGEGLPEETPCIEAAYIKEPDVFDVPYVSDRTYTFPTFRLARIRGSPSSEISENRPVTIAASGVVKMLDDYLEADGNSIENPDDLRVALMESDVDGEILSGVNVLE